VAAVTVGVLLAAAALAVMARVYPTLVLFGVGLLVAHLADPYLDRLQRRGWSRAQAVWVFTLAAVILLGALLTALTPPLVNQVQSAAQSFPEYASRAHTLYGDARDWALARARNRGMAEDYVKILDGKMADAEAWLTDRFPAVLTWISGQLMASLSWLMLFGLLLLVSFHFMLIIDHFRAGVRDMLPVSASGHVSTLVGQMSNMLGQYLRGLLTTALFVGMVSALALGIVSIFFGTRYWLLLGLAHGFLYVIPWVGGAVADLAAAFFGYTTAASQPAWAAVASLGAVVVVNQLGDIAIMPRIVGRRVGLHPLAVLFGILAGYQLFGLAGTLVATPMMVAVKIVLAHWLPLRGPSIQERAPGAPVDIDIRAAFGQAAHLARSWGQRVEHAVRHRGHGREEAAFTGATAEGEAGPSAGEPSPKTEDAPEGGAVEGEAGEGGAEQGRTEQ
jgi:predicted PurR-regulated permease PerM